MKKYSCSKDDPMGLDPTYPHAVVSSHAKQRGNLPTVNSPLKRVKIDESHPKSAYLPEQSSKHGHRNKRSNKNYGPSKNRQL